MFRLSRTVLTLLLCLGLAAPAFAGHGATKEPRRAIVVAAFGTTVPEAAPAIEKMVARVKAAYPGVPVSLCYTAAMIRAKLGKKWVTQATINMADDEELLALAARAGSDGTVCRTMISRMTSSGVSAAFTHSGSSPQ